MTTPEKPAQESTPIGDAVQAEVQANPGDVESADPVKADVKRALERETQDGKGDEDPGPGDWISYATEGVEKETDK